ncbi:MAG: anti-sigma F factor [Clostridia bacterium]|nr:anti-sigma F factor [Clostridia bacterium]
MINEFTVRFPSRSANESFARSAAAAFVAQLDPTVEELYDIKTAVSEAVTNCIVHGYRDTLGSISMTVRLYENGTAEIIVRDRGCGIDDVKLAREPMFTTGGADRSGMGFTIMESFMDKLSVRSVAGWGTTVKMSKRLTRREAK